MSTSKGINLMTSPYTSAPTTYFDLSGDNSIDALITPDHNSNNGGKWGGALGAGANLTFSFPWINNLSAYWQDDYGGEPIARKHFGLNTTQQNAVSDALQQWENVANVTFSLVTESSSNVGDFRFAFSSYVTSDAWGWSMLPHSTWANSADVWLNTSIYYEKDWGPGSYNFEALMHEIGHGLGLKHPGNYNGANGSEEGPFLPEATDNRLYTIMSYNDYRYWYWDKKLNDWVGVSASTPMILDIQAIQYIYGTNNTYETGDNVYSFSKTTPFYQTIWDAGGNDTMDISNFSTDCTINLNPGLYSSLMFTESSPDESIYTGQNNLGIAYGCLIENAIGGSGNDTVLGNSLDNQLVGGGGNDNINGGSGNDEISGGLGTDSAIYYGNRSNYTVIRTLTGYTVIDNYGLEGSDNLSNIEQIVFLDNTMYFINGTDQAEKIVGTSDDDDISAFAGKDNISALNGDDTIDGGLGDDSMTGGLGDDTYYVDSIKDKVSEKASQGNDTVISTSTYVLAKEIENLTLAGIASINATGNNLINIIIGNESNNIISGGLGNDSLTGDDGADVFLFNSKLSSSNIDTIIDFNDGDKIGLAKSIFKAIKITGELTSNAFYSSNGAIVAHDLDDRIIYNTTSGALYYDADGTGTKANAIQIAIIGNHYELSEQDFLVM